MVSTIAAKIAADMRAAALAASQGMHVCVGDFNLEKANFAVAVQEGFGDGSAHQICGAANRDFGMCVGTGIQAEVKQVLDRGGEHKARVFHFFPGKPEPFPHLACVSSAALNTARDEIEKRTNMHRQNAIAANEKLRVKVEAEESAPASSRGRNFVGPGFDFPLLDPEPQVLDHEPVVEDPDAIIKNLGKPFVEAVYAESVKILDQGIQLPDEAPIDLAKDQRDHRQILAVLVSRGLKRGIWQCYLGGILAEE